MTCNNIACSYVFESKNTRKKKTTFCKCLLLYAWVSYENMQTLGEKVNYNQKCKNISDVHKDMKTNAAF